MPGTGFTLIFQKMLAMIMLTLPSRVFLAWKFYESASRERK